MNTFSRFCGSPREVFKRLSNYAKFLWLFFEIRRSNKDALNCSEIVLLSHLGYGDQIICLPIYKYLVEHGKKIKVIAPERSITFLRKAFSHNNLEYVAVEEAFKETLPLPIPVSRQGLTYAKRQNLPLLTLGYELLDVRARLRPEVDFNSLFYEFGGVPIEYRTNFDITKNFKVTENLYPVPVEPYALVDHFPGTLREIPQTTLADISQRGLRIVLNPRDVPYEELFGLIKGATELHFVNSSLFCLSMSLNVQANSKNIYLIKVGLYHGLGFYDQTWKEWILNDKNARPYSKPLEFDSESYLLKMQKKANAPWRKFLDRLIFGWP